MPATLIMQNQAEKLSAAGTPDRIEPQVATPIATLDGLTKRYGAVTALDGVSLALRSGEIVALLGPNGAGKSTAVRLLLGLSTPTSGQVRVFGRDPRDASSRSRVGAMLQVASVPKTLKVKEHIDLFRSYYPNPLSVAEIARIAQLEGLQDRLFEHLSGGQRQRLLFGLAICGNPDLVFLDEPTVGMDIEARRGLWQQIRSLASQGKTVLMTTHYLEEADALASRIIVLNQGRIVSEGTPAEIKNRGAGRIIRCITQLPTDILRSIPGVITAVKSDGLATITATHPEAVLREMFRLDDALSGLEVVSPGLEDAFLALTAAR